MFNLFRNKEKEIENAKNKLIDDLTHNGITNLIRKMNVREPYSPLIKERQLKNGSYSSEDSISMIAYGVSNTLNNPNDKQELLHLLDEPAYQEYRKYAFCYLASLCSNTGDYDLFDFLLKHIEIEDDESIIVSVLSRLDKMFKPRDKDIRVIKFFLVEGTVNTQQAAIKALSNSEDEEVEDLLLSEFKVGNRHVKGMICIPLLSMGTKKAITVLQAAYKQTREPLLRHQIEYVLDKINNRERTNR